MTIAIIKHILTTTKKKNILDSNLLQKQFFLPKMIAHVHTCFTLNFTFRI